MELCRNQYRLSRFMTQTFHTTLMLNNLQPATDTTPFSHLVSIHKVQGHRCFSRLCAFHTCTQGSILLITLRAVLGLRLEPPYLLRCPYETELLDRTRQRPMFSYSLASFSADSIFSSVKMALGSNHLIILRMSGVQVARA